MTSASSQEVSCLLRSDRKDMWEFRGLSMKKSASSKKSVVKPAATKFISNWNTLQKEQRLWIIVLLLWAVACVFLYINNTESDAIELDRYYDSIDNPDTDRIA